MDSLETSRTSTVGSLHLAGDHGWQICRQPSNHAHSFSVIRSFYGNPTCPFLAYSSLPTINYEMQARGNNYKSCCCLNYLSTHKDDNRIKFLTLFAQFNSQINVRDMHSGHWGTHSHRLSWFLLREAFSYFNCASPSPLDGMPVYQLLQSSVQLLEAYSR